MQAKDINSMVLWSAKELQQAGFSRSMAYSLLNRSDVPTVRLGSRVFVIREAFLDWLKGQAEK